MVMARKQVLVQLNDKLLGQLDRAQAMSGQSRSQLIRTAIAEHLETLLEDDIDRQYIEGYTKHPPDDEFDELHELAFRESAAALDAEDGGW
jgi:metal-responsive CopG/Arc/MetJ family transcriptional regulator